MTFGTARWGSGEDSSRAVFNAYVDAGGNFVGTADVYSSGRSEELLGRFIAERGLRNQMVVATKAGFSAGKGVHAGGNGAKHVHAALDGSLGRLQTDHVDCSGCTCGTRSRRAQNALQPVHAIAASACGVRRGDGQRLAGVSLSGA